MKKRFNIEDIEKIVIKLASPEEILELSHGEVTKPETVNYRTGKPDRDGLFSEVIFGPTKDYECFCGKYRKPIIRGIKCDRCGVDIVSSAVRRERFGHITLMAPITHIWFLKTYPYPLSLFLNIPVNHLEKVIYFEAYIITRVNEKEKEKLLKNLEKEFKEILKQAATPAERREKKELFKKIKDELQSIVPKRVLSDFEYFQLSRKYPNIFEVEMGSEPIRRFLEEIDLNELKKETEKQLLKTKKVDERRRLSLKLRFIKSFIKNNYRPEWMILTVLPIIPPDLRPIVTVEGGHYISSDLNELYRRVINRNNRLKRLIEMRAPEIILRNEMRMLQDAVDALLDNSMKKTTATRGVRKILKSLADSLRGKEGRFRQNLLGKRVDYSGRAVIVIGPELKINECGLPKRIAVELFKPFIIHELLKNEIVNNIKKANHLIEMMAPEVLSALERVIIDKYVLLNRAPTLHRLGIQAFKPVLVEGTSIRIPALVCTGYNADFDGDQMAVYLPISEEAQKEAKELMAADKNILKPGTGEPIANPNKDMIAGIYYLTTILPEAKGTGLKVYDSNEAKRLFELGIIDLRAEITVKHLKNMSNVKTSVGRILFNEILPMEFPYVNEVIDKKKLNSLIEDLGEKYDLEKVAEFLDNFKDIGFKFATISGLSLGYLDTETPVEKKEIIAESLNQEAKILAVYEEGLLSEEEKKEKISEIWFNAFDSVRDLLEKTIPDENPVKIMLNSGARGSWENITQVMGIKGLVKDPKGAIIDLPITESYQEGFSILSYFISTHAARKGTADTALKTSHAGYLTRRMAIVAQDVIIKEEDCKTEEGLIITRKDAEETLDKFWKKIYSRTALETIKHKSSVIVNKGEVISKSAAKMIDKLGLDNIKVRSPFTCKTLFGICSKCYGLNLANDKLVKLGEAVGIIAAQSIGEPGTQLTMRTFHTGGIAVALDITEGIPRANELLEVKTPSYVAFQSPVDGIIEAIEATPKFYKVVIKYSRENKIHRKIIKIPKNLKLLVRKNSKVKKGQLLNEGILDPKKIYLTQGKEQAFKYILNELKKVYNSQGAEVHDKHFEVILRKMFSLVKIYDPGDSDFVLGEILEKDVFMIENKKLKEAKKRPAKGKLLLRGITNVAIYSKSFIAAASFQNTVRILVQSALEGKEDYLTGINENIIIGRKPPIGSAFIS